MDGEPAGCSLIDWRIAIGAHNHVREYGDNAPEQSKPGKTPNRTCATPWSCRTRCHRDFKTGANGINVSRPLRIVSMIDTRCGETWPISIGRFPCANKPSPSPRRLVRTAQNVSASWRRSFGSGTASKATLPTSTAHSPWKRRPSPSPPRTAPAAHFASATSPSASPPGLAPIYRTVMGLGADGADGWDASKATGLR